MADLFNSRRGALGNFLRLEDSLKNEKVLQFRPTDVLIVGPAKSGTTWLQQILHQIRTGGDEEFSDIYDITKFCPKYIVGLPNYQIDGDQLFSPRIFKSHSSYEAIPMVEGMKLIVVVREPLDAVWSQIKFLTRSYGVDRDMTFEEFQHICLSPSFAILHPWEFVANWYPHRNDSNVMWLRYEDILADLMSNIRKLADFLGVRRSEAELQRICHFSSFEYMSSHKEKFTGGEWLDALMCLPTSESRWQPQMGMVRVDGGKVGQGGKDMPVELKEFVLASWKETVGKSLGFNSYQDVWKQL